MDYEACKRVRVKINPEYRDLPAGYTQVKYLQSSGTQWIDTGYNVSNDNIKVEVGFDGSSQSKNAWGFVKNVGDTGWFTPYGLSNNKYGFYCGTSASLAQHNYTVGVKTDSVYETNNGTITITRNGTQVLSQAYTGSFTSGAHGNFMLFTQGGASQSSRLSSSYIWYLRLYENNTLVRNLIPARNSNNILGMYDKSWDNTKCGVVDLGTLYWSYRSDIQRFEGLLNDKLLGISNIYSMDFINGSSYSSLVDKGICSSASTYKIFIRDDAFGTDVASFKQALNGKILYYQRETDTTWQPPFYTNSGTGTFILGPVVEKYITYESYQIIRPLSNNQEICFNKTIRHKAGRLPVAYQEVEYLKSDGNQYIDTGIKLASTDIVTCKFKAMQNAGAVYGIYGSGGGAVYANNTYYTYVPLTTIKIDTDISVDTNWHTIVHNFTTGKFNFDGTDYNFTPTTFTNTVNNCLFVRYYASSYGYNLVGCISEYNVVRNGNIIQNLVPCYRKLDNKPGYYDLINNELHVNQGTGEFEVGPDVN